VFYVPGDEDHWGDPQYINRVTKHKGGPWWSCDQENKKGDYALLYARKPVSAIVGIIAVLSDAYPEHAVAKFTVHEFACEYRFACKLERPLTIGDMRSDKQLSEKWGFVRLPMAPRGRPPRIAAYPKAEEDPFTQWLNENRDNLN
jgi:hypothetical protein